MTGYRIFDNLKNEYVFYDSKTFWTTVEAVAEVYLNLFFIGTNEEKMKQYEVHKVKLANVKDMTNESTNQEIHY